MFAMTSQGYPFPPSALAGPLMPVQFLACRIYLSAYHFCYQEASQNHHHRKKHQVDVREHLIGVDCHSLGAGMWDGSF